MILEQQLMRLGQLDKLPVQIVGLVTSPTIHKKRSLIAPSASTEPLLQDWYKSFDVLSKFTLKPLSGLENNASVIDPNSEKPLSRA